MPAQEQMILRILFVKICLLILNYFKTNLMEIDSGLKAHMNLNVIGRSLMFKFESINPPSNAARYRCGICTQCVQAANY